MEVVLSRFRATIDGGLDWILDLLTTLTHDSQLHFTDHTDTQTSVLSVLQSPLAVPWQRILTQELQESHKNTNIKSSFHSLNWTCCFKLSWSYYFEPLFRNGRCIFAYLAAIA
jgi:hypothetical protein